MRHSKDALSCSMHNHTQTQRGTDAQRQDSESAQYGSRKMTRWSRMARNVAALPPSVLCCAEVRLAFLTFLMLLPSFFLYIGLGHCRRFHGCKLSCLSLLSLFLRLSHSCFPTSSPSLSPSLPLSVQFVSCVGVVITLCGARHPSHDCVWQA